MNAKPVFIDTNILVYANDSANPEKQKKARESIRTALIQGSGVLSTQVLAEFWVTVTKKLPVPLDYTPAREQIALFSSFMILPVDHETVLYALQIQQRYSLSYWDAQIIACARLAGVEYLWSEDLQHGAIYEDVQVHNPLASTISP